MGSFANTLFKILLGWLQGAASAVWAAFTTENGVSLLTWIGRNWLLIAGALCIIGLTADLCVYILRWKPYKVWKNHFSHKKDEEKPEIAADEKIQPEASAFHEEEYKDTYKAPLTRRQDREEEADLSQWQGDEKAAETPETDSGTGPATVTNAGYVVPADSPYRRPVSRTTMQSAAVTESGSGQQAGSGEEKATAPVSARKRRRIRVSELFSDPEEEIHEFDAPQHFIDARKAYHEPVYPRGWKKNEEKGE